MLVIRRVHGKSMEPALQPGSIVIGLRRWYRISPGDVVIIQHNGLEKIKRIYSIHEGMLEVRGDNPRHSTDSRQFGQIPQSSIVAKVINHGRGRGA